MNAMNARRLASLSLLLVVACGGQKAEEAPPAPAPQAAEPAPPADAWRRERPKADPVPELHAPVPVQKVLTNGLTVLSVPKPALPIVNVSLIIKSGSAQDPAGQEGVAGFTADMLKNGTAKLTAEAIADEVETRGSSIDVDVDEDSITLSATALKENIGAVFDVMADLVQHAAFQPKEIERARKQRQASLAQSQDDPARTANRVFRSVVYGGHPYGHTTLGTTKALKKLGKKELQAYFAAHFRPANAAVVVVGDWTVDEAQKEVDKRLGAWKGKPAVQAPPAAPQAQPAELALVARSGAPQSQLMVGHLAVSRADPDYFSLVICNAILGGLFNSRINMNLR
ncbi:MAG TPA: pitrilysin family protein, partial [Myxococcota bacterium]|nr:pitrilysin family protein [Myxococcota bacterium]